MAENRKPTPMEKINICMNMLDNLVEAKGRAKCGYIYAINDFLEQLRNDFITQEQTIINLKKSVEDQNEEPEDGGVIDIDLDAPEGADSNG